MKLEDTVALVTGAAKRVGRVIALHLASLGCHIAIHYRSSKAEAEGVREEIRGLGRETILIQADLARREEAERAAGEALAWKGRVAILVNSAATYGKAQLGEVTEADWNFSLEANLLGPFWLSQVIGPKMMDAGGGKIVNIADTSWLSPWPGRLPYCVSKGALVALSMGMAKAYAPQVQVNAIGPGPVLFPPEYSEETRKAIVENTLVKREGTPMDVALAVEFFCRSDFVTGVFLPVEGGQLLKGG